jgi:hypothetical protein
VGGAPRSGKRELKRPRLEELELRLAPAVSLLVTSQPPDNVTAGTGFGLTVSAEDGAGHVDTSFNGKVNVYNYYGSAVGGTQTVTAVDGVAAFSGLSITQAGVAELVATTTGLATAYSKSFSVGAAAATHLVVAAPSGTVVSGSAFDVQADAVDTYGNVDPAFNGGVAIALDNDPTAATLGGTLTVTASGGVADFPNLVIATLGHGYTLQATSTGLTSGTSPGFDVTDQLVVTTPPPAGVTAGHAFGLVITAEDGLGHVDTSFSGPVTLANTLGPAPGGTLTVQAVNGVASFSGLTLDQAGSANLSATSSGLAATATGSFKVSAAAATQLVVSGPSGNVVAGSTFSLRVVAEDPFANVDLTFKGSVAIALDNNPTSTALGGTLTATASHGAANYSNLTIAALGQGYTVRATSAGLSAGDSPGFNVTDQLVVTTAPPGTVTAGNTFGLVVTAEDGLGHVDTSFAGTVTLTNALGADPIGTVTVKAVNGAATFSGLALDQAGSAELVATSGELAPGSSAGITVNAAAATHLAVQGPSGGALANAAFDVQVNAVDPYGNVDPNFNGMIKLALDKNPTGAVLGGTLSVAASGGVADFPDLVLGALGSGYTFKATSVSLGTATSSAFDVTDQLVVTTQPPSGFTAGTGFGVGVAVEDGAGKVDTSFSGNVTLADAYSDGPTLLGTTTAAVVNGLATFSGLTFDQAGFGYLSVSSSGPATPTTTNGLTANPAAATQLVVQGPSGTVATGSAFATTVLAEDSFGNVDYTFDGNVTIAFGNNSGGGTLGGTLTLAAYRGAVSFSDLVISAAGRGYTLQASGTGLSAGTSSGFDAADRLVVTTPPPADVTAGSSFGLVVSAEDAQGHVDTTFNGKVTLTSSVGPAPGGTLTVTAANGVATFSGLTLTKAGSADLAVQSDGPAAATDTGAFTVTGAAATSLTVQGPGDVLTGSAFTLKVVARDPYGNMDPNFKGSVGVALDNNPGGSTLGGTLSVTASGGLAQFTDLTLDKPGIGYTLRATAAGLPGAPSSLFTAFHDRLTVTTAPPASVTAGSAFGLVVSAEDAAGTVDPTFVGNVTISSLAGPTPLGALTVRAVHGVATFAGLTLDQAGTAQLLASSSGAASGQTGAITVHAGTATHWAFQGLSGNGLTGSPLGLTVAAEDAYGNVDPNFHGSVTVALGSHPTGAGLAGMLTGTASGGSVAFPALSLNLPGSGYTLRATGGGLPAATSLAFNVTADQLVVTTAPPSHVTAGSAFGLVVAAENGSGQVDTSFNGIVTVALLNSVSGGPATPLFGTLTAHAVNGVATFSGLSIDQAGTDTLVVSSSGLPQVSAADVVVGAAPATHLAVKAVPAGVTANAAFALSVVPEDAYGNVDPSYAGAVAVTLANNPGGAVLTAPPPTVPALGVVAISGLGLNADGNGYTIQATGPGLAPLTIGPINVTSPGVGEQLAITTPPPGSVAAGDPFGMVVSVEDGFGTVDTSFNGSVTLSLNAVNGSAAAPLVGTLTVSAVSGVATFTGLGIDQAGSYTITAAASGLAPATSPPVTVTPASASHLAVLGPAGNVLVGAPFGLNVVAEDPFGNAVPTFDGTVTIALASNPGGATLGGTLTAAANAGVAAFTGLTLNQPGTGYTVQATTAGLNPGTSLPFDVTSDQLIVTTQPPATVPAGSPFGFTVSAVDANGNVDTSFNGAVTAAAVGSSALGGTLTVSAVSGVATFSDLTIDPAGTYVLSASSNGVGPATTNPVSVMPGAATQLVVMTQPPHIVTPSVAFPVTVAAEDPLGNVDPTFIGSVSIALDTNYTGASLGGTLTVTAIGGVAVFTDLVMTTPGAEYTLQATASGVSPAVTQPFDVGQSGVATQLVIATQPPASVTAGHQFGFVVDVEDNSGAVQTSYAGDVSVALAGPAGSGATLGGTLTVAAVNGVATFDDLTINRSGKGYTLQATAPLLAPATTAAFDVTAGPGAQLVVVTTPQTLTAGQPSAPIDVRLEDSLGNSVLAGPGGVIVSLSSTSGAGKFLSAGGLPLSSPTVTIAQGASTAAFEYEDSIAGDPTLTMSATGLTPATQQEAVDPGAAGLVFTTAPLTITAGQESAAIGVELQDQYGNLIAAGSGGMTLSLTTTSAGGTFSPLDVVIAQGSSDGSFQYEDTRAGTPMLTAAGPGVSASQKETITGAAAAGVDFTTPSQVLIAGQQSAPIGVELRDKYDNIAEAGPGGVSLALSTTSAGGTFSVLDMVIAAGTSDGSFEYKDTLAGTPTLTVTGPGYSNDQQETVDAAGPASVDFTTAPQTLTAGQVSAPIGVELRDKYDNLAPAGPGGVTLSLETSSAGGMFLSMGLTIPAGASSGTFQYKDTLAGTPTLTVAGPTYSAQQDETVDAAGPAALVFTTPPQVLTAGQASGAITVELQDQFGNPAPAGPGGLTLALSSTSARGAFLDCAGQPLPGASLVVAAGNSTASFKYIDCRAGSPVLKAAAPAFAQTQQETVNPAAPGLAFTTPPQSLAQGQVSTAIGVQLQDQFGNPVTAGPGGVAIGLGTTSAGGMFLDDHGQPLAGPSITVAAGASTADFEYVDVVVGTPVLTLTAPAMPQVQQQETITPATGVVFTTPNHTTFALGQPGSFTIATVSQPTATLSETGPLPRGVTFVDNGNGTATLSGTPLTTTGAYTFNVTGDNGFTAPVTQVFTLTVTSGLAITSANSAAFMVNKAGSFTVTATQALPLPIALSESGKLPAGVTFKDNGNGTGTLAGTPTPNTGGSYALTFTATSGSSQVSQAFTLTVSQAPGFTSASTTTFALGQAGSFTVKTSGYPAPVLTEAGALPGGVTFKDNGNGTATISGTPGAGSLPGYVLTLTASNGVSPTATQKFTLTVGQALAITSANHATFKAGSAGSFTVTTSGGSGPVTLCEAGGLPGGVTFKDRGNGTALLSGTPAAYSGGTCTMTITAACGSSSTTQSFTLAVNQAPDITSANAATFTVGQAGSFTVKTSGYPTPTITEAGTLPGGVSFKDNGNGTATLSGTPAAGSQPSYVLTLTASNGLSPTATQKFTLTVGQAPTITSANHATFTVGSPGSFTVTTSGGSGKVTITESGTLPGGVTLKDKGNGTAVLGGTPAAKSGGTYTLTITAACGSSSTTQSFTLTVNQAPAITSPNATTFTVGQAGSFTVKTSGYPTPAITEAGALPVGVSFKDNGDGTATLGGTPAAGSRPTYVLTITAGNGTSPTATQKFTLTVGQAPTITSANHATFTVGSPGTFTVTTSGGSGKVAITESGAPPSGVTLNDKGNGTAVLSGTPAPGTGGTYTLTITAACGGSATTQTFTLTVKQAPAITSASKATFAVGQSGSFTVQTTGFPTAALNESGALPAGVKFRDNGDGTATLSGTPAAGTGGNYVLTLTASNGVQPAATQKFTLTVSQPVVITSADSTTFMVGQASSFTVTTAGFPVAAISLSGTKPAGITFKDNRNGTATLSGTPGAGAGGTYSLVITANNGSGPPAQQLFTLTVKQAPAITSAANATFTAGKSGSFTVTTTGFPVAALSRSGSLPGGLSFTDNGDGTGTLSGKPSAGSGGSYSLVFTATNGVLPSATQTFTLTVNEAPAITSANAVTFTAGQKNSFTVTTSGFPAATLSETGAPPAGVTFVSNGDGTATLSGTPASGAHGTFSLTITASNGLLPDATQTLTLTLIPGHG